MIRGLHDVTSMAGGGRHSACWTCFEAKWTHGFTLSFQRNSSKAEWMSVRTNKLMSSFQEKVLPCWPVIEINATTKTALLNKLVETFPGYYCLKIGSKRWEEKLSCLITGIDVVYSREHRAYELRTPGRYHPITNTPVNLH